MKSLIAGIVLVLSSTSIVSKPIDSNTKKDVPSIETRVMITKHEMVVDPAIAYQKNIKNKIVCINLECWDMIIKDHKN